MTAQLGHSSNVAPHFWGSEKGAGPRIQRWAGEEGELRRGWGRGDLCGGRGVVMEVRGRRLRYEQAQDDERTYELLYRSLIILYILCMYISSIRGWFSSIRGVCVDSTPLAYSPLRL